MTKSVIKKILILLLPLLLFFILLVPYSYVNSEFIVDWLGCGCPKVDVETGEMITDKIGGQFYIYNFDGKALELVAIWIKDPSFAVGPEIEL